MQKSPEAEKTETSYYRKPQALSNEAWQAVLRKEYGQRQNFKFKNTGDHPVFSDFEVANPETKKTYKVAIRSENPGLNFCSCPDFLTNTLGTCKHIEFVIHKLKKQRGAKQSFARGFTPAYSSVFLKYGAERKIMLRIGATKTKELRHLSRGFFDENNVLRQEAFAGFEKFAEKALKLDPAFRCYHDALNFILEVRAIHTRQRVIAQKYPPATAHKTLDHLLKTNLYAYQKEGILFAAAAGRCLIADDMGLGKTIQAIGATELMVKEFGVEKVLVICPTSLKYQWEAEIKKFAERSALVIEGMFLKRSRQYEEASFYKIASYNSIARDLDAILRWAPDIIILDEAQRIKNWKTRTARSVKSLSSPYAFVLTGTPLENRLEELHSVVQFIDKFKLGPLFKFLEKHQVLDERGKVVGYKDLNRLGETLSPIVIRRNKKEVLKQLPERIDKNFFVPVTEKQWEIHQENAEIVRRLVFKWIRYKFLTEKERQRLLICLNCMRMVCNTTFILDETTNHGTKIDELLVLVKEVLETKEKMVIFSQWERMTRLVARELTRLKIGFLSLHGGVPSRKRKELLDKFRDDSANSVFLSTDAGGVGLNLQSASVVINLDLPWNPAVLEQRIGRVHRLGQTRPVRVVNFIARGTIEENLLGLIGFKKSVFAGVLDGGENNVFMKETTFSRFMKTIEQVTAAPQPGQAHSPVLTEEEQGMEKNEKGREASGGEFAKELFSSGIAFLEKLGAAAATQTVDGKLVLSSFIQKDGQSGKPCLNIPLPDDETAQKLVSALGALADIFRKR